MASWQHGTAAVGIDCVAHNEKYCAACDVGYRLEATHTACNANVCTCRFGTAATGAACSSHNAEVCAACDTGWALDRTACAANVCTCAHGSAAKGAKCATHNAAVCASCDVGWHLDGTGAACYANVCSCDDGGAPATGASCTAHGATICRDAACYSGTAGAASCSAAAGCGGLICDDGDASTYLAKCVEGETTCKGRAPATCDDTAECGPNEEVDEAQKCAADPCKPADRAACCKLRTVISAGIKVDEGETLEFSEAERAASHERRDVTYYVAGVLAFVFLILCFGFSVCHCSRLAKD